MKKFHAGMDKLCHGISHISMVAAIFAMMVLVIDIILKYATGGVTRVKGNYEMVEMAMVVMMFLSMGTTQLENGHVRVDMFVKKFPPRACWCIFGIVEAISTVLCLLMMVKAFGQVAANASSNTATAIVHIPYAPFNAIMGVGMLLFAITLALTTVEFFQKMVHPPVEE